MDQPINKAKIVIGDVEDIGAYNGYEIYYYPTNITEWELIDEIEHLSEFYARVALPIVYPPHIREKNIRNILEKGGKNYA